MLLCAFSPDGRVVAVMKHDTVGRMLKPPFIFVPMTNAVRLLTNGPLVPAASIDAISNVERELRADDLHTTAAGTECTERLWLSSSI